MHRVLLIVMMLMSAAGLRAQEVMIYGRTEQGSAPEAGVLILVFDSNRVFKRFITDKKGEFRFSMTSPEYMILFYKPGMLPTGYKIENHMTSEVQKIPVNMGMTRTTLSADSILAGSPLITKSDPAMARAYIEAIYEYERRQPRRDTSARSTRRTLVRKAVEERDRFATYHKSTTPHSAAASDSTMVVTIGPDIYEMVTDIKGAVKYYKNDKPISEATYTFETTRRYEGVLKNTRDVRRFEKYKAAEHRKDSRVRKEKVMK